MTDEYMDDDNDQLLGDLLNGEIEDATAKLPTTEDVNALRTQIESLENEKKGLLNATKEERKKRQATTNRLNQLEGAVTTILSQRQQQGLESLSEGEAADARGKGIPVSYDDDGNAWIDDSHVNSITSKYEQRIAELEQQIQNSNSVNEAQTAAEMVKQSIIGENEQYGPAAGRYRAARQWVEEAVRGFAQENGVNRPISSGEALEHVFDNSLRKEFADEFKGFDIVDIISAEDSRDHFRRALDNIVNATTPQSDALPTPREKMDSRFQKVLKKPSALGNQANAKAGQSSILEKVGRLSSQDIMDLDDAQIDALMRAAGREEEDGIF